MSTLTSEAIDYIGKSTCALLITVTDDHKPSVRFIGPFINDGLDIYFMTAKDSRKLRHIDRNPFVTLYFQNPDQTVEAFKSLAVTGKAVCVPAGNELDGILEKLGRKSPGFRKWVEKEGFGKWTICKITAGFLQWTDFSKSTETGGEEIEMADRA